MRVVDAHARTALAAHVVTRPELAEAPAALQQLGDERAEERILGGVRRRMTDPLDEADRDVLPVGEERALIGIEEDVAQLVSAACEAG